MAQNKRAIDSLQNLANTSQTDSIRLKALLLLSEKHTGNDPKLAIFYGWQTITLAKQLAKQKIVADGLTNIGKNYKNEALYDSANWCYQEALSIYRKLNATSDVARILNNLGVIEKAKGNYINALNFQIKSLDLLDEEKDKMGTARTNMNIGTIYLKLNNPGKGGVK